MKSKNGHLTDERIADLVGVIQTQYVVFLTKEGRIELRDHANEHVYHTFENWKDCEAWAVEMEW